MSESRKGVLLMPSLWLMAGRSSTLPGRRLPSRICCRMYSYTIILPETAAVSFPARDGAALDF